MTKTSVERDLGKKKQVERTNTLPVKRARVAIGPTPPLDVPTATVGDEGFKIKFPTMAQQQLFLDKFCNRKVIVERLITLLDFSSESFSFIPPIFECRGWLCFTVPPIVYIDMAHEFYTNIYGNSEVTSSLTTYVRGKVISLIPDSLAKIMYISFAPYLECSYPPNVVPTREELGNFFGLVSWPSDLVSFLVNSIQLPAIDEKSVACPTVHKFHI